MVIRLKSDNYFIGDSSNTTENQELILGYSANGSVIHSQSGDNSYTSSVSNYSSSGEERIITFIHSKDSGKKTYINGVLAAQSSDKAQLSNISEVVIGKEYTGEIGEIIIFNKALNNLDRQYIANYLAFSVCPVNSISLIRFPRMWLGCNQPH